MDKFLTTVVVGDLQFFFLVRGGGNSSNLLRVDTFLTSFNRSKSDLNKTLLVASNRVLQDNEPDPWDVSYEEYDNWLNSVNQLKLNLKKEEELRNAIPLSYLEGVGNSDYILKKLNDYEYRRVIYQNTSFTNRKDLERLYLLSGLLGELEEGDVPYVMKKMERGIASLSKLDDSYLVSDAMKKLFTYKEPTSNIGTAYIKYLLSLNLFEDLSSPAGSVSISNTWEGLYTLSGILQGKVKSSDIIVEEIPQALPNNAPFPKQWKK